MGVPNVSLIFGPTLMSNPSVSHVFLLLLLFFHLFFLLLLREPNSLQNQSFLNNNKSFISLLDHVFSPVGIMRSLPS